MFNATYQLPVVFGADPFPTNMHPPTSVRVFVDATEMQTPGADPDAAAQRIVDFYRPNIYQFVNATRQAAYGGGNDIYNRVLALVRCTCIFQINHGQETLSLYIRPSVSGGERLETLYLDIRTIFYHWPIPGAQMSGTIPPNWEFNAEKGKGNKQGTFYSFYNPPFAPGDRANGKPVMAVGGDQPTKIYEDFKWEPIGPRDPKTAGGYVEELWLDEVEPLNNGVGGTGFYDELLKGKQYWEAEIKALPSQVPGQVSHALSGTDDGSSYEDPTIKTTPNSYLMKYPSELDTFLNPIIGVIPKHWVEDFVDPDKPKSYSQNDLDTLPQVPPRDTTRFTHKLIGLDPDLRKPRSIGAVRSSVIKGDEVTTTLTQSAAEYKVTFGAPYGPYFATQNMGADYFDSLGRKQGHWDVPSGWDEDPRFFGPGSATALEWHLAGPNPYYDVTPTPATNPSRTWFLHEYSVANGQVYQIIDAMQFGTVRENEGTYSAFTTTWFLPGSGPPPGFLAPGAPAKRWPLANGGPYWRCVGFIGGPWYGPAYIAVTAGSRYDDPGSSFPTAGPTTEIRTGVAVPDTHLVAVGGGPATKKTDTFPNQLFGDFLREPDSSGPTGGQDGGGGTRKPRKVAVPLDAGEGRYMPVIKGRGDFMEDHYRDKVTEDTNFDPTQDNYGYDSGVDLGDVREGDRLMFASDTKTGQLYVGRNGLWIGPDGGAVDFKNASGFACLMDREKDPDTGELKDAEYYAAASYRYGHTWIRLWLGQGLKYKVPEGFDLLGRTTKPTT